MMETALFALLFWLAGRFLLDRATAYSNGYEPLYDFGGDPAEAASCDSADAASD